MVRRKKGKPLALLIDSNISPSILSVATHIRPLLKEIGDVKVAKIVMLQKYSLENSKKLSKEGFTPIIVHGDLDIHFALEAMELVYNEKIDILALVTENEKFIPLICRARELGKEVVLLLSSNPQNQGLQKSADLVLPIDL
ncbi:MAG: NYN domain-containing protein [Candidatus Hodarchaeota archaeon]